VGPLAWRPPAPLPGRAELAGAEEPQRIVPARREHRHAYNITTGFDDNDDSIFNDRPAGVGRNAARTTDQITITGNLTYSIALGVPAGARAQERPGGERGDRGGAQGAGRYRLVFTAAVNNLANRANFSGFSGIRTSLFYLTPTSVTNPRKFEFGIGLRF
jgi:hypothetical protein